MLKSPYLRGSFKGISVVIFSDLQLSRNDRQKGSRTIFQVMLSGGLPSEAAIGGSPIFRNFMNGLSLPEEYKAGDSADENAEYKDIYIRAKNISDIKSYLTKERLGALKALTSIKGGPAVVLITNDEVVIRIESVLIHFITLKS